MLDVAIKYSDQLKKQMLNLWFVEKYKYWNYDNYHREFVVESNTWNNHQFVSIDNNGNIIGYIGYTVDRLTYSVYGLSAINFTENKIVFGNDLRKALIDIFEKFNFHKLKFAVVIGNPIEKSYDKLIEKYGGRIVGVYEQETKLIDDKYYDEKIYEITRENYLNSIHNTSAISKKVDTIETIETSIDEAMSRIAKNRQREKVNLFITNIKNKGGKNQDI